MTTPGDRTISRPGDQQCRSSAVAGQHSPPLSRPGDGEQGREKNSSKVTQPELAGTPR